MILLRVNVIVRRTDAKKPMPLNRYHDIIQLQKSRINKSATFAETKNLTTVFEKLQEQLCSEMPDDPVRLG